MKAHPIKDNILFAFLNETSGQHGVFKDKTRGGIILPTMMDEQRVGRWAKALLIGPEVTNVTVGQYIFIKPLMWTQGFTFDGIKIWKTDASQIIAVSDDFPDIQVS